MSLGFLIQGDGFSVISSDTASSSIKNKKRKRVFNDIKKIHEIGDFSIILMGDINISDFIIKELKKLNEVNVEQIRDVIKKYSSFNKKNEFIVDCLIYDKKDENSYQISKYNDFNIIKNKKPEQGEIKIWAIGFKTKNAHDKLVNNLEKFMNIERSLKETYLDMSSEEIGGDLEIRIKSESKNVKKTIKIDTMGKKRNGEEGHRFSHRIIVGERINAIPSAK